MIAVRDHWTARELAERARVAPKGVARQVPAAFTLVELLVVLAAVTLLISLMLPGLSAAREQGKRTVCLANVRTLCQAMAMYSCDDRREHAVPIQQQMVSSLMGDGFRGGGYWALTTALPFSYGGRTAQAPLPTNGGLVTVMTDPNGRWAARTRPLNRYVYHFEEADSTRMPVYRCPSDSGFPADPFIADAPSQCADIPCYDVTGNSYRVNMTYCFFPIGNASRGENSGSPYGHRLSTLANMNRTVLLAEPCFFSIASRAMCLGGVPEGLKVPAWHRQSMTYNVGFLDGSARPTCIRSLALWSPTLLRRMKIGAAFALQRGESWQIDCYPTPGAWVPKFTPEGQPLMPLSDLRTFRGWPYDDFQYNFGG